MPVTVDRSVVYYDPALNRRGIKRCFCLTSDVCLSDVCLTFVAYIGRNSRTERPRKTKIGTEVAHVIRDSDTTFKVKGQLVADVLNSQHAGTGTTWRINTKILSNCRGRRHIVAAARLQRVVCGLMKFHFCNYLR